MMKRRHFNLIKTGRKSKLALAVGLALAMSAMGSVYASGNDDTFKNFANGEKLNNIATSIRNEQYSIFDEHINRVNTINEFQNSTGLASINADKAYALGYTGNGVKLGMMENGLPDILHKDLNSNGENNIQNKYGNLETSEHSTHVVGIMAARKNDNIKNPKNMHGVAYNSKVDAFGISKLFSGSWKDELLIKIGDDIVAVNESFGGTSSAYGTKIINESIINKGGIIVKSIGNGTEINPSINGGIIDYDNKKYRNNYITVGALDSSSSTEEASFLGLTSNTPGNKLSKTTVMAPGVRINSTKNGLKYGEMTGTSMAAPHVTGISALVKEAFPYLSGKGLCDTILSTANNKFRLAPVYCQLVFTDDGKLVKELKLILVDNKINNLNSKDVDNAMKQMYEKYLTNQYTSYEEFKQADIKRSYRECTREEVFGQGIVDAVKAVQGLGAIDVDRLSQEDITTRYSNDKFYMYQVDTKKAEDNFKGRNYSIWSNDISEKNVNDIHAGLEKTGSVGLILLGENTYTGPTVAKGGFLQIVRGVGGDVYVGGDSNVAASAEINGYAKNIYALESGKVKISDIVSKNYANVDADFLAAALPDTNKVDINGGLFAIGKNSITGEGSTINVNLTRYDSAIKGALYQDELGKINLSLANEAKFILQQGTGYYAGNSYKSNDTVNNFRMDSFATFDMSQDGVYSTLKIDKLQGRDGQFILGTNLANCKGDSIFVTGSDAGEHWISIVDKNGVYADNEDGAKKVLVATTPDNVKFKGLALAQDMGVNQYNFTPNIYYDENIKGWYFNGFDKVDDTGAFNDVVTDSKVLTTNAILNKGISNRGNGIFNFKVLQAENPAMLIKRKESNNGIFGGIWGSVKFLGDGPIKVDVENTNSYAGMQNKYSRTIAIGYNSDLNYIFEANQNVDIKVTSGSKRVHGIYCAPERDIDYKSADGIYGQSLNGKLNSSVLFNSDLSINVSGNGVNQKYVGIENTGAFTVKGKSNITIEEAYDGNEVSIYNYGGNMRFYGDSIINGGRLVNESKKYYDTINKNLYSYENPKIYFDKNLEFYNNDIENHGELIINGDALLSHNAPYRCFSTLYNSGKCNINGDVYLGGDLETDSYFSISNGSSGIICINGSLSGTLVGNYIENAGTLKLMGSSAIYNYSAGEGSELYINELKVNKFVCYPKNANITINDLLDITELRGDKAVFKIYISQEKRNDGNITSAKLVIGENKTEGAKHTIELLPMQTDFLLTNDTKINPFTIIEDSSEKNGGYKLNFTINPFDAGAYNYTPTLTNEKSKDNVDLWKVTDIKLTGSTPDPTPDPNPNPTPNPDPNPDPTPNPDPNPNPTPDPDPNPNPTPDPNPTPAPVLSHLTYNTRANAINNYYRWRDEYNNLQKRLGDLRMSTEENGLWARTFHGKEESGKYGLNNQYNAFQIGYDKQLLQDYGSKWFVGAAVTSYDGKTNYAKQGKADNNSIGLALYGSYLGEKGHYFDVVARHSRLKSELTSYAAGTGNKITGDYHNWGSSLSMEYGRRISMKHDFYLQPEAELTYGTTSSASYSLSDGSRVKQDGISSLTARAGLTVGKEFKNSNIFASISAVHDFGDDNVFSITDKYGKTYKDISNLKDSWYELSVGGNVKFNNNTYIYADLEKTFGGDIQTKWRYNFGVRYSF